MHPNDELPPCIGERYRDTAQQIAGVVDLDRVRADRSQRRDTIAAALRLHAERVAASPADVERARAAGVAELDAGRSIAWAVSRARAELPRSRRRPRRPTMPPPAAG